MKLSRIEIPKRQPQCSGGDHPFLEGDKCYTLVFSDEERWNRQDLCEECWHTLKNRGLPDAARSYWQVKVPIKPPAEDLPKHKEERALVLLKRALAGNSLAEQNEAFILALYLARKKFLQYRQALDQLGECIYLYEIVDTEELLAIKKMSLDSDEIIRLQKRLAEMLTDGGDQAKPASEPPPNLP